MNWDLKSDRPIYFQLIEEIERRIISGVYPLGTRLPSVRDLATEAAVNPNTMQRALAELENQGLLYSQRTSGRFVTEDEEVIKTMRYSLAQNIIKEFMEKMNSLGYDSRQTIKLLEQMEEEKK
ncbi:GntR family transcriptional regulator [Faecalispora anaeroviscerum]|uniref:GntR family transcriptional regulator n=1 Tax=Faecalispora anaeroviscerum TaxID=2991836 RepID=UPI0024BB0329|nr:GntR family transcriptional regulator [Faecalispora anaeroviscerum]